MLPASQFVTHIGYLRWIINDHQLAVIHLHAVDDTSIVCGSVPTPTSCLSLNCLGNVSELEQPCGAFEQAAPKVG